GLPGRAHPSPHETTPTSLLPATSGPPESPWQASLPPSGKPAQTMPSGVYDEPYAASHSSSEVIGTSTFIRWSDCWPPSVVLPQPSVVTVEPASYAGSSRSEEHTTELQSREKL